MFQCYKETDYWHWYASPCIYGYSAYEANFQSTRIDLQVLYHSLQTIIRQQDINTLVWNKGHLNFKLHDIMPAMVSEYTVCL